MRLGRNIAVDETIHPEPKNVPMAVAGDPQSRHGIILAKNEVELRFRTEKTPYILAF